MIEFMLKHTLRNAQGEAVHLDFQASIERGAFVGIVGPSGAGKTTLLRMLAGLTRPDHGYIKVDRELWLERDAGIDLPARRRSIGFVFQDYALFPNLDVRANIAYGVAEPKPEAIDELLHSFRLQDLGRRRIDSLSGGQKQRVALARAVAHRPALLLLDEPLAALDSSLRLQLQDDLADLHHRYGMTTLFVTHDVGEVFKLSSRVLQIDGGRIVRHGSPRDVFLRPALSGKVSLHAQILDIQPQDVVHIVSLLVGQDIVQIVATPNETAALTIGEKISVSAKALAPLPARHSETKDVKPNRGDK